jgi:putative transcriptional regulator
MNRLTTTPKYDLAGHLLVAFPHWNDSLFRQAVCLVVHHSDQGAIGVLLNKLISIDARSFWQQVGAQLEDSKSSPLYLGGPHSGPVVAMHQRQDLAEYVSAEGVYFAAQLDSFRQLAADRKCECRFFVGQATWEPGQLDQQFAAGCWLPQPVQSRVVFEAADAMWRVALREAGNQFLHGMLGTAVVPPTIECN